MSAEVFSAVVLENKSFLDNGMILVQLSELKTPLYAEIMTPIGGLENMAMQWVPPVGAHGYLLYKGGDERKPVWIGSKLLPWDKANATTMADAEIVQGVVEADDGVSDFIIKTQNTTFEDQDTRSKDNKIENILKMSKGEFTLAKVKQGDKYEYKTETYDIKTEPNYQIITMTDDKINIRFNSSSKDTDKAEIIMTEGETKLLTSYNNKTATITMSEGGVLIDSSETSTIQIDKDGNINITGKKMVVSADKIELGGNGSKGVLFEPLRDFINQSYMKHTHATPSGPSGPPPHARIKIDSKKVKLD